MIYSRYVSKSTSALPAKPRQRLAEEHIYSCLFIKAAFHQVDLVFFVLFFLFLLPSLRRTRYPIPQPLSPALTQGLHRPMKRGYMQHVRTVCWLASQARKRSSPSP